MLGNLNYETFLIYEKLILEEGELRLLISVVVHLLFEVFSDINNINVRPSKTGRD